MESKDARNRRMRALRSSPDYHRSDTELYSHLKTKARLKGREMTLTFEQFQFLRGRSCAYCGSELPRSGHGIDRMNNELDYTWENSVPCCGECNKMKGRYMTHAEMKAAMNLRLPVERKYFINQLPL